MHSAMSERIAYGRQIQDEATRLLTGFGAEAIGAAQEWADRPGLTLNDKAFRNAVLARVARMLGEQREERAVA